MAFPPHHSGLPQGWAPPQLAPGGTYPWEGGPVASSTAAAAVAAAAAAAAVTAAGGGAGSRQVPLRPMTTFSGHLTGGQRPSHQQTVGAKRGVTGAAGDAALETKRMKRLEKNRESARECRKRKKQHKEKLEEQLAVLDEENLDLRLRLKVGDEAKDAEHAEILQIKARLDDEVSRGVEESQILQTMDLLKDRFADYGSVHVSATEFHLEQLSRLLQPTLTTRACMHAVLQTVIGTSDQATKQTDRKPNSEGSVAHAEAPGSWREEEEAAGRGRVSEIRREQQLVGTKMGAAEAGGQAVNRDTSGAIEEGVKGLLAGSSDVDGADVGARTPPQSLGDKWEGVEGGDIARLTPHTEGLKARDDAAGIGFGVVREGAREEVWVDMWSCLVDVLEASEGQQAEMRSQAGAISELAADLGSTTGILNRLKLLLADRNQTLDGEMAEIQRILTPTQTAKFVLWVSRNEACVHMLNQLWDKLHGDISRDP